MKIPTPKPCPFCGKRFFSDDLHDYLYPTGSEFRYEGNHEDYDRYEHKSVTDYYHLPTGDNEISRKLIYTMHCTEHNFGCGAEISAVGIDQCVKKWNTRTPNES
jgi:hypothetical protein